MKDEIIHYALLPKFLSEKNGDRPILWFKGAKESEWKPLSSNDFYAKVTRLAHALRKRGVGENSRLAVYSQNCPEAIIADFANFTLKATTVPVYATSSCEQLKFIVDDAQVKVIYTGDQAQFDNAVEVSKTSASVELIVALSRDINIEGVEKARYYDTLELEGTGDNSEIHPAESYSADDIATIMYTSGTTGNPKGVVLMHSNYLDAMKRNQDRLVSITRDDRSLTFLPITHVFERAWCYLCMTKSVPLYVNYNPKDILVSLKEVRPTLMCGVPRFWEKVYLGILRKINMMPPLKKGFATWALAVARQYNVEYIDKGREPYWWLTLRYKILNRLVFKGIRETLGIENGNFFPVAGSSLSNQILLFLRGLGIPIMYGYGLTESTATVACFDYKNYRIGSVGRVLDGLDVKIGEDDEILIKGGTITKGYFNNPEANKAAFTEDGYFRTGDAGKIEDGHLYLTERIKDLFKTSNGKYIAPQQIEMSLAASPYIEQIMVVGDNRNYVTALIVPDFEALKEKIKAEGWGVNSVKAIIGDARVYRFYESEIDRLQAGMAPFEHIKKFSLIPKGFTLEGGELTNTLKFRRLFITQKYATLIERMYDKNK
ncbi:MAG: long-chain fatty acid--CoA ligase [Paludibacteraceae bacterium]|nr:long-chain fatty acid--CoA ligase [Paludibacteraceae bacterium]